MVTIEFNPTVAKIREPLTPDLQQLLYNELAYKLEGTDQAKQVFYASRGRLNKQFRFWDGWNRLFNRQTRTFPTGLIAQVLELIESRGGQVVLQPTEDLARYAPKPEPVLPTLRDYQATLVSQLTQQLRSTVQSPTASGKSIVIAELCLRYPNLKTLVLVPSKYLLHQTRTDLAQFTGETVGIWGDSEYEDARIIVATVQSAAYGMPDLKKKKNPDYTPDQLLRARRLAEFEYTIYDEAHLVGSDQHRILAYFLTNAWQRHGVSATLNREDGAELLLTGIIGPKVHEVGITTLIDQGYLSDVAIELHEYVHDELEDEPDWKETQANVLKHLERTRFGLGLVKDALARGYTKILVLYQYEDHGKQILQELQTFCPDSLLIDGKASNKKRQAAIDALESGHIQVLVASTILDVGVNIPCIQVLIPLGAGKGVNVLMQRVGRILRKHSAKAKALVLDIYDRGNRYLEAHANRRLSTYCQAYGSERVSLITAKGVRETMSV